MKKLFVHFLFAAVASQPVLAKPSFDCRLASTSVEHAICGSEELSKLDKEMADLYFRIKSQKSGRDFETFTIGGRAWSAHRNNFCSRSSGVSVTCLSQLYRERIASLKSTMKPTSNSYQLVSGQKWLNLASRANEEDAILLAKQYQGESGRSFNVFLSDNGWYAVVTGPISESSIVRELNSLEYSISNFDPETYTSDGKRYHNLVYRSESDTKYAYRSSTASAAQSGGRCSRAAVKERQAVCYILAVGEYACAEGLEKATGYDHGNMQGEVSAAIACNVAITKLAGNEIDPDALVASALIGGLDSAGESLQREGHGFWGGLVKFVAFTSKVGLADACAQTEARNCGY